MRRKAIGYREEWLEGDFEPPPPLKGKPHLSAWRLHDNQARGMVAMKVQKGAGVWSLTGQLLFYREKAADVAFSPDGEMVWNLENVFGRCASGAGVAHVLQKVHPGSWNTVEAAELCVPSGGLEYLIIDRQGRIALATWLDQTEWGYLVVDLAQMKQLPASFRWDSPTISPPAISPDARYAVSCQYLGDRWWNDDPDDESAPSPGGVFQMGTISVHDLQSNQVSNHPVSAKLPSGWLPDKPNKSDWSMIWGPDFVGDREIRIWLPDATERRFSLPLPKELVIEQPLGTTRPWLT